MIEGDGGTQWIGMAAGGWVGGQSGHTFLCKPDGWAGARGYGGTIVQFSPQIRKIPRGSVIFWQAVTVQYCTTCIFYYWNCIECCRKK